MGQLRSKTVLIDIAHAGNEGRIDRHEQTFGTVLSASVTDGVVVLEGGTSRRLQLPPDFRSWKKLRKGNYQIPSTNEIVRNPAFESLWVIPPGGKLSPAIHQVHTRKSSYRNFYGIGTAMYGRDLKEKDGSFVTTKWVILFLVPIFPLGSFRIYNQSTRPTFGSLSTKHSALTWPLNKKQVIKGYGFTLLVAFAVFFIILAQQGS